MNNTLQRWRPWLVLPAIFFVAAVAAAEEAPPRLLTTAAAVRNLTVRQAAQHYPVKLRGVVTFYDDKL